MNHVADEPIDDNERDTPADEEIKSALTLEQPNSFFLFAGAGSGKTRSLKTVLETLAAGIGVSLRRAGRRIAVITYTNVACEEILRRVGHDPLFEVKTIHSFAWSLIEGRNDDIREWLKSVKLPNDLAKLKDEQARGRAGTNAHDKRERKIASKLKRLDELPRAISFTYNPNGDNVGRDSLSHEEVISMTSDFLTSKETLQKIVLGRYPFVLIDESQDTLKPFMEALLAFEAANMGKVALGLFGDTMQRVYSHGLADLAERVPGHWKRPAKVMNHRSRARVVEFANSIRADADQWRQLPRSDRQGGHVRIFVAPSGDTDRTAFESAARARMAAVTADPNWRDTSNVKTLTIERHMAAERLGFSGLFEPLDGVDGFRTGFRDGTLASMRLFSERLLPLVEADRAGDSFELMRVLRKHSPLLAKTTISAGGSDLPSGLERARIAVESFLALFDGVADPTCAAVLKCVAAHQLFEIPEALTPFSGADFNPGEEFEETGDERIDAWAIALNASFSEVVRYRDYVLDLSPYGTHQGVKGLEFPRVMVIADDASTRFKGTASYEKLLGAKRKSRTDLNNEAEGKDTALDRTRRLLYVTCTRAEESLALVVYSEYPKSIADTMIAKGWVKPEEIEC